MAKLFSFSCDSGLGSPPSFVSAGQSSLASTFIEMMDRYSVMQIDYLGQEWHQKLLLSPCCKYFLGSVDCQICRLCSSKAAFRLCSYLLNIAFLKIYTTQPFYIIVGKMCKTLLTQNLVLKIKQFIQLGATYPPTPPTYPICHHLTPLNVPPTHLMTHTLSVSWLSTRS